MTDDAYKTLERGLSKERDDGLNLTVAVVRCRLYQRECLAPERVVNPGEAILSWDHTLHGVTVRTVAVAHETTVEGWQPDVPSMGSVADNIDWSAGHRSDTATVIHSFADGSVLLAVVTTPHGALWRDP